MRSKARARHEALNGRLKQWGVLSQKYRGSLQDHYLYFDAVVNVVQTILIEESPLFKVEYKDN